MYGGNSYGNNEYGGMRGSAVSIRRAVGKIILATKQAIVSLLTRKSTVELATYVGKGVITGKNATVELTSKNESSVLLTKR